MNYKFPGLVSLSLFFIALFVAAVRLFLVSELWGAIYFLGIPFAFLIVLYAFCRKCPHVTRGTCRHVVFGSVVRAAFTTRQPSPYTFSELMATLIPIAALVIIPQYWLFQVRPFFILFWILAIIAGIMVKTSVCPKCENSFCCFCPTK